MISISMAIAQNVIANGIQAVLFFLQKKRYNAFSKPL
jgi:hypothetical protein